MKNILIAINAEKLNISDVDFGCQMATLSGSRLTGIFLENQSVSAVTALNEHAGDVDEQNLKQYLRMHYSNVNFHMLDGDTNHELIKFLFNRTKALVVMGAYSRSKLSRAFFPSTAEKLIKGLSLPIFIAHP